MSAFQCNLRGQTAKLNPIHLLVRRDLSHVSSIVIPLSCIRDRTVRSPN